MEKRSATVSVTRIFTFLLSLNGKALTDAPLKLVQHDHRAGVQGQMDYTTVDVKANDYSFLLTAKRRAENRRCTGAVIR